MKVRNVSRFLVCGAAVLLLALFNADQAQAGWGSYGSSGGSWGGSRGYGSSGGSWGGSSGRVFGSYGSYGSSGGHAGPFRRLAHRIHSRPHHQSSGGSWGSSGGSRGYYASSGGSSGGSWGGSSGGSSGRYSYVSGSRGSTYYSSVGSAPVVMQPAYSTPTYAPGGFSLDSGVPVEGGIEQAPTPAVPLNNDSPPPSPERTGTEDTKTGNDAVLNLRLPAETVVYVNGKRTKTPGEFRSYVSRNLNPNRTYTYEIRAELNHDGEKLTRTKVVQLTAGAQKTLDVDFDLQAELITSVTILVPDEAKVELGGVPTRAQGPMRYFSTNGLKSGQSWNNYTVSVTVQLDGQPITKTRVIDVSAGDSVQLQFDFEEENQVASR